MAASKKRQIAAVDESKTSDKKNGIVEAFAANTHCGVLKESNDDRVSIVTNLLPPKERKQQFRSKSKQ